MNGTNFGSSVSQEEVLAAYTLFYTTVHDTYLSPWQKAIQFRPTVTI